MGVLLLDVLHSKTLKSIGKIEIHEITQLSASHPIDRLVTQYSAVHSTVLQHSTI